MYQSTSVHGDHKPLSDSDNGHCLLLPVVEQLYIVCSSMGPRPLTVIHHSKITLETTIKCSLLNDDKLDMYMLCVGWCVVNDDMVIVLADTLHCIVLLSTIGAISARLIGFSVLHVLTSIYIVTHLDH